MMKWKCPYCKITQEPGLKNTTEDRWDFEMELSHIMFPNYTKEYRNKYHIEYLEIKCSYCGKIVKIEKNRKILKRNYRKRKRMKCKDNKCWLFGYDMGPWSPWYKLPLEEDEE